MAAAMPHHVHVVETIKLFINLLDFSEKSKGQVPKQ